MRRTWLTAGALVAIGAVVYVAAIFGPLYDDGCRFRAGDRGGLERLGGGGALAPGSECHYFGPGAEPTGVETAAWDWAPWFLGTLLVGALAVLVAGLVRDRGRPRRASLRRSPA